MAKGTKEFESVIRNFNKKFFDIKFWTMLAGSTKKTWDTHFFKKGRNVYDVKFKPYSKEYGDAKKTGQLPRQSTQYANTYMPVLTGDLLNDFKIRSITGKGFSFGTISHGGKVLNLNRLGRTISEKRQVLPKGIQKDIMKKINNMTSKLVKKGSTNIIKFGK
jgi:hypothetical protein